MSISPNTIFVTGVPTEFANRDGSPTLRLEISHLKRDVRQWSLYIQALKAMQDAPERLSQDAELTHSLDDNDLPVNPMSWFGIASIHGEPYASWNDAPRFFYDLETGKKDTPGYCRHGSTLFPTWHRAYLALFEQALHFQAQQIVKGYAKCPDAAQWIEAARTLRAPFWDWVNHERPPREVYDVDFYDDEEPTLQILMPNNDGTSTINQDFHNPLLWYQFKVTPRWTLNLTKTMDAEETLEWDFRRTVRHTYVNREGSTVSNPVDLGITLDSYNPRDRMYYTLTENKNWLNFSNHTYRRANPGLLDNKDGKWKQLIMTGHVDPSEVAQSLESVHDAFHNNLGGRGFMSWPSVAAFDPIFWLHHCNVDRMFALWQELHPGVWVEPFMERTHTGVNLGKYDMNSPLLPFWRKDGNTEKPFWTSADDGIQDWTKLNYTYPDFIGLPSDPQERQRSLNGMVNVDYGVNVLAWQDRLRHKSPVSLSLPNDDMVLDGQIWQAAPVPIKMHMLQAITIDSSVSMKRFAVDALSGGPSKRVAIHAENDWESNGTTSVIPDAEHEFENTTGNGQSTALTNSFVDWRVRVRAARFALDMGYTVLLFLGAPSDTVANWRTDQNLVGMHSAFTNISAPKCENCVEQADAIDISVISITQFLDDHGKDINDTEEIKQYVEANLNWRIQKVNGEVVDPKTFPSLITDILSVSMVWSEDMKRFVPDTNEIIARGDWVLTC